jgi:hypothetical protein
VPAVEVVSDGLVLSFKAKAADALARCGDSEIADKLAICHDPHLVTLLLPSMK